jgi:ADP-dependent NAD(P)H-hydrate dehydratase / NAD(P)H-hydrate epimerase
MLPILTPDESAALDRASGERGIGVDALMENAGHAVARAAVEVAGGAYGRRAVVVCGKGNNGGDGLVAARYLDRWGMGVTALLMAGAGRFRDAAAVNLVRLTERGVRTLTYTEPRLARELARADVVIDAVFGTGFRGRPEGPFARALSAMGHTDAAVIAVDIPSGVEGETGAVRGEAVRADITVTMGALKPGVIFFPGAEHAGVVRVVDIGFPEDLLSSDLWLVEPDDVAALVTPRGSDSHKRSSGVVVVVAGSRTMTGAAVLAAMAAYRAGAGLVTLAVPEEILTVVEEAITEPTFLPLPQTEDGTAAERAWDVLEERLGGADAVAVGPGLTTNQETVRLVRRIVAESPIPLVLDADGLNAFTGHTELLSERRSEAVLTPHPGEFGRLTGLSSAEVLEDRVGHARKAAAELRCTLLLKGSRTVVAEPDGTARVNPTGGPFLATGGTGDVLTGAISAFLARGLRPPDAAVLAAWVHGEAGRVAASAAGEGTTAGDVCANLGPVLAGLREQGVR